MDAVLGQDGGEVGLGFVVLEGAVAEHAGGVAGGGECGVPLRDAQCQRFGVLRGDAGVEAGQQHAAADGVHRSAGDLERDLIDSVEHIVPGRSEHDLLTEILLKLGLDLCVPIETRRVPALTPSPSPASGRGENEGRSSPEGGAEFAVHAIGGGVLMACLDTRITAQDAEPLALGIADWHAALAPAGDTTCVFRDSAFENDEAKTNLAAILSQHGIGHVRSL